MIERYFRLKEHKTDVATEVTAGLTTFVTMSYVIFVQPAVLSIVGVDFGSVMTATCIAAAVGSIMMGLLSNLPVALAPAMGHNFFYVFTVCGAVSAGGYGFTWQAGLGAVFVAGLLFALLSLFGMRDRVVQAMPHSLKFAISAGIGLFIALIGLKWGGVVVANPPTLVRLGSFSHGPAAMVMLAVVLIGFLLLFNVRGALLIGIGFSAVWSLAAGYTAWHGLFATPPSIAPTFLALDIAGAFSMPHILTVIFIFFILDLFDTIGTLTAVCSGAGLMVDGRLPKAREALFADGASTVVGSLVGTTTVTSYIESAAGVTEGGRTGLTAVVAGVTFLAALFFYPLAKMIGGGYEIEQGVWLYPVIAPALIIVGSFMMKLARHVEWNEPAEALPAFLTIIGMPFTFSITEGVAFGIISYSLMHTGVGRTPRAHPIIHFLAALFVARYLLLT